MPPAFVLSQDQTLKFDVRSNTRRNKPNAEPLISRSQFLHITYTNGYVLRHMNWLSFYDVRDAQKPSQHRAAAHMSLHLTDNVKEPTRQLLADNHPAPSLRPGDLVSVYVGDRSFRYRLAAPRPVKSPLDGTSRSVKPFFEIYMNELKYVIITMSYQKMENGKLPTPLNGTPPKCPRIPNQPSETQRESRSPLDSPSGFTLMARPAYPRDAVRGA